MKTTQAWGWLIVGVMAAGLNAAYHDGGLPWAHGVANRVERSAEAVLALASGSADQFLTQARMLRASNRTSCPWAAAQAWIQDRGADTDTGFAGLDAMQAREEAQMARLEVNRARMETQIEAQAAHFRVVATGFNFSDFDPVKVPSCPRVRVNVPPMPKIRIPAAVVRIQTPGAGPV